MENERIETENGKKKKMENGGQKRGTDRNRELRREMVMPETVVKDRLKLCKLMSNIK